MDRLSYDVAVEIVISASFDTAQLDARFDEATARYDELWEQGRADFTRGFDTGGWSASWLDGE